MKLEFSRRIFVKYSNVKFHENYSSGSRVVPCGRTDKTKLIVALCNFANVPKNDVHTVPCYLKWHRCFNEKYVTSVGSKTRLPRHEFLRVKHIPPQHEGEWCVLIYRE